MRPPRRTANPLPSIRWRWRIKRMNMTLCIAAICDDEQGKDTKLPKTHLESVTGKGDRSKPKKVSLSLG